jgi:hypothetical protein
MPPIITPRRDRDLLELYDQQVTPGVFLAPYRRAGRYGWPHDIADEEILARLLTLNLERAAAQGSAALFSAGEATDD